MYSKANIRQALAQAYCTERNKHKELDADLLIDMARILFKSMKASSKKSRKKCTPLSSAVKCLCRELRKDEGLYIGYQSNIAMSIYDNFDKYFPHIDNILFNKKRDVSTLLEFCNICAKDFLDLWIRKTK